MEQRILGKLNALLTSMLEASNASFGEHGQVDGILSRVAREFGTTPNNIILYEERPSGDGESIVRVGVRRVDGSCSSLEEAHEDNAGFNTTPPVRPEPWRVNRD